MVRRQQPSQSSAANRHAALKQVEMLSGLSDEELAALEGQCHRRSFRSGNLIIGQHDGSRDVLFLVSGLARVNVYSAAGKKVSFRDIRPGAVFGELSAIDAKPRSADVEAIEDCELLIMPQAAFTAALSEHPGMLHALLLHLSAQVRSLTERVFEFSTLAVRGRVQAELLRLAEERADGAKGATLSPAPTHSEIANRISTHREAVTRELNRLEAMGIVSRQGRSLRIPDIAALKGLVGNLDA